jgi:hypothetical protein
MKEQGFGPSIWTLCQVLAYTYSRGLVWLVMRRMKGMVETQRKLLINCTSSLIVSCCSVYPDAECWLTERK